MGLNKPAHSLTNAPILLVRALSSLQVKRKKLSITQKVEVKEEEKEKEEKEEEEE